IYTEQGFKDLLAFSEKSNFYLNLFVQAAIWGAGAALTLLVPPVGALFDISATSAGIILSATGSAAASLGSEAFGNALPSYVTKISLPASFQNYSTLVDVANNVAESSNFVWSNMLALLQSSVFRQHIYSNYGLLQALQSLNPTG